MNRIMLEQHLTQAEEHVALSLRNIMRQRHLVVELERDGHDTAEAERLLTNLQVLKGLLMVERDKIRHDLAVLEQVPVSLPPG